MDQRILKIFEVDTPCGYGLKPYEFKRALRFDVGDSYAKGSASEIRRQVENANLQCPTSYDLHESNYYSEWGASGAGQDVVLMIAAGIASGAAQSMTSLLIDWMRSRIRKNVPTIDLAEAVRTAISFLKEDCQVSCKMLVESATDEDEGYTIHISAPRIEKTFAVKIDKTGSIIDVHPLL